MQMIRMTEPAWAARCCCYNGHPSASGRCNCRSTRLESGEYVSGVLDPTRHADEFSAVCDECRENCPAGRGTRLLPDAVRVLLATVPESAETARMLLQSVADGDAGSQGVAADALEEAGLAAESAMLRRARQR